MPDTTIWRLQLNTHTDQTSCSFLISGKVKIMLKHLYSLFKLPLLFVQNKISILPGISSHWIELVCLFVCLLVNIWFNFTNDLFYYYLFNWYKYLFTYKKKQFFFYFLFVLLLVIYLLYIMIIIKMQLFYYFKIFINKIKFLNYVAFFDL